VYVWVMLKGSVIFERSWVLGRGWDVDFLDFFEFPWNFEHSCKQKCATSVPSFWRWFRAEMSHMSQKTTDLLFLNFQDSGDEDDNNAITTTTKWKRMILTSHPPGTKYLVRTSSHFDSHGLKNSP